tara:strand:- start:223 stop:387 length:165 start_codon:yes stop_codon:yes gene_type:complete
MGENTITIRQFGYQPIALKSERYTPYLVGYRSLLINYWKYIVHFFERYTTLATS